MKKKESIFLFKPEPKVPQLWVRTSWNETRFLHLTEAFLGLLWSPHQAHGGQGANVLTTMTVFV